jgi:hypothetical protein
MHFLFLAFLMGVECLSQKIACIPVVNKSSASWEKAITKMIEESYGEIRNIVSDRDSAVTSEKFRRGIYRDYGVKFTFLRSRSKAFKAENMIKFMKRRLSIAMKANPKETDWTQFVDGIVKDYNSQKIPGTNITRNSVNKNNYMQLLEQLYKSTDASMLFNVSAGMNVSPSVRKTIWRYNVGDKVLLNRNPDYTEGKDAFLKTSVKGTYGETVYTITEQVYKTSHWTIVPTYRLNKIKGLFYEAELFPVLFQT